MVYRRFFPILFAFGGFLLSSAGTRFSQAQIYADLETTLGSFTLEMFHNDAPLAAANFIGLAEGSIPWLDFNSLEIVEGVPFYNGIAFHRVVKDFMIQGGSPNGKGTDNPGYQFVDQFARDTTGALLHPHNQQGLISMANSGINTNGAQFFITDEPTPWLDGKHVVFGKIAAGPFGTLEEGLAVITAMNETPTTGSTPDVPLVINSITIRRIGEEAIAFDVHAQGLPKLSGPRPEIVVNSSEDGVAELRYPKPALTQIDVLASNDLVDWRTLSARYFGETDSSADDITAIVEEEDAQFFRLLKIEYDPQSHAGGPDSLAGGSLKLDFNSIFDIDIAIDASGINGSWIRPDGNGEGSLESVEYIPRARAYVDRVFIFYEGLVNGSESVFGMRIDLSFDTPTSGRFSGDTNGNPQKVSGTFEFVP